MNNYHPWKTGKSRAWALAALCSSVLGAAYAEPAVSETALTDFAFRDGQIHSRKVREVNGLLIAEHDMIMGFASPRAHIRSPLGLSNSAYGRIWPNGVVPYRLSSSLSDAAVQKVRDAVAHWNSFESVTLVERTDANASAYPHYIDFVYEDRCASWIGFQGNGAQSIYTGNKCSTGTLIHEIGHALGLLHEHTRSDRDQYVNIRWDRIQDNMDVNFEILEGNILLGEYDYGSIMHYGEYFFSKNGMPTIEPIRQTNAQIGQRVETSQGDRDAISQLYRSNLSLTATSAAMVTAGEPVELTLQATNSTEIGANSLSLSVPVEPGTSLLSFSSMAWSCEQSRAGADVECTTPVLTAGASSDVTLSLSTGSSTGTMYFDAILDSRTHDSDATDNYDSASVTLVSQVSPVVASNSQVVQDAEPKIASALSADGGGGSFDTRQFLLALLMLAAAGRLRRLPQRTSQYNS